MQGPRGILGDESKELENVGGESIHVTDRQGMESGYRIVDFVADMDVRNGFQTYLLELDLPSSMGPLQTSSLFVQRAVLIVSILVRGRCTCQVAQRRTSEVLDKTISRCTATPALLSDRRR